MQTKQLHLRLETEVFQMLVKISDKCGLTPTAIGAILIKSAIESVKRNGDRVPLPLDFEVRKEVSVECANLEKPSTRSKRT